MDCINKSHPKWKELIAKYDEFTAIEKFVEWEEGQSLNTSSLLENKSVTMADSILSKLGNFDTYFRSTEKSNELLLKMLKDKGLTDEEINYLVSLENVNKKGSTISYLLSSAIGKSLQDNIVVQRLNKLKNLKYDQELENKLVEFAKSLGITHEIIDSIKGRFGIDATGVADLLNKVIYLNKERKLDTFAEEVSHFYIELLGTKTGLGKQIFDKIEKWQGYSQVYDKYSKYYKLPNGQIDVQKIKKEAAAQAVAEAIVKKHTAEKDSFWKLIIEAIEYLSNMFSKSEYLPIEVITNNIATKILNNDISEIQEIIKEVSKSNQELKTYEETLRNLPNVKNIIDNISKLGGLLTGSLAIRKQGTLFRNKDESVHDLDFSIPFDKWNNDWLDFITKVKSVYPNYYPLTEEPYLGNGGELVFNGMITEDKKLFDKFKSLNGNFNDRMKSFTLDEQSKFVLIDFFFYPEGLGVSEFENVITADHIFSAKSNMGMRAKDAFDLLNYKPYTQSSELSSYSYYQLEENQNTPQIKPGVAELFESNPELANAVYETLGFSKKLNFYKGDTLTIDEKIYSIVEKISSKELAKRNGLTISSNIPVYIVSEFLGSRKGGYDTVNNIIILSKDSDKETIHHELIHSVEYNLDKSELNPLYEKVKDSITEDSFDGFVSWNFKKNISEFVADALSKKVFRNALKKEGLLEEVDNVLSVYTSDTTPQQKQQAQQLYSQYLDTIFPDSKVKGIYTNNADVKIEKYDKSFIGGTDAGESGRGFYFTPFQSSTDFFKAAYGEVTNYALLNVNNNLENISGLESKIWGNSIKGIREEFNDVNIDGVYKKQFLNPDAIFEQVVFEPEQIHILGSKQDIEGFKEFVNKPKTNNKPDVILPIGTSGSGKSTFIKSLPQENLVIIEPDAMRVEFTGDMNDKSKDKEIYVEAANRAIQAIKQGKQVVFDTTNLTKDKRLPFIEAIKKAIPTANIQYKLMELNPELAKQRIKAQLERGENRAAVSDETIDRHAASYKQMLEDIKNEPISEYKDVGQKGVTYIGNFNEEGKGTFEGDGKDKQMRKDSIGFIGELNPSKKDRFESSTYGSFKHFSNENTIEEDRYLQSLPTEIKQGDKIMLALNGSINDKDILNKTKEKISELNEQGVTFLMGDMPHSNTRLGDSNFLNYIRSIKGKYIVYGNGSKSRIDNLKPNELEDVTQEEWDNLTEQEKNKIMECL